MNLALSKNTHPSSPASGAENTRCLAHDARNWLTVLQVYCDLLRTSGVVASGYERWVEELSGTVERGHGLVASLLESLEQATSMEGEEDKSGPLKGLRAIRKPENEKNNIAEDSGDSQGPKGDCASAVDLAPALTRRLPLLQRLAGNNIHVEIDAPANTGKAMLPEAVLERILLNLVGNAIEAMPQGGRLRITARRGYCDMRNARRSRPSKAVLLRVTDTGNGIAPEVLPSIFEAGISGKARGEDLARPHGYGLAIVRDLAERAGGAVRVRSRPGKGSCFEVKLPRAEMHREVFDHAAVTA